MVSYWEPGTQYNYGDVVQYEGFQYKIIQPHRSQSDWTPPVTPALWGRCQDGSGRDEKWGDECKPAPDYGYQQQQHIQRQETDQSSYQGQEEHKEQSWFDEHEKELKVGGGLLAGAAALGAGLFAYKHHEQKKEERGAHAWVLENWMMESQVRTEQWRAGRYNGPVAWIRNKGKSIPRDAIQGGEERGQPLYICRVYHEGGIMVGKASNVFNKGAVIGFEKSEFHYEEYEILVGDSRAVRWVACSGQLKPDDLRARPVEGGREPGGALIYIAQAPHHGAVHPGKACEVYGDGCFIPYDGTEKKVKEYAVLCYA